MPTSSIALSSYQQIAGEKPRAATKIDISGAPEEPIATAGAWGFAAMEELLNLTNARRCIVCAPYECTTLVLHMRIEVIKLQGLYFVSSI